MMYSIFLEMVSGSPSGLDICPHPRKKKLLAFSFALILVSDLFQPLLYILLPKLSLDLQATLTLFI